MKRPLLTLFALVLLAASAHARTPQPQHIQPNFELRGVIEKIGKHQLQVAGKRIRTLGATWLDAQDQPVASRRFKAGDQIEVKGVRIGRVIWAKKIIWVKKLKNGRKKVALLFVGHGEPAKVENGDIPITFPDGEPFGPHADGLGVPEEYRYTEWAAAYEEIATAMTYIDFRDYFQYDIIGDLNGNGILHDVALFPAGDVPPFFTWDAFHADVYAHYEACANYSPHNDALKEHIDSLEVKVDGAKIDTYLAFLDAVPRIRDVVWDIAAADKYEELVVVPLLVASSTHTQEVTDLVEEAAHLTSDLEVVVTEPFFEVPFMRKRLRSAVVAMAEYLRTTLPADVPDSSIGVVLASHGTPYVSPFPEFGWKEGEIYSNLIITEDAFHKEIASRLPWKVRTGRMSYSSPTIEDALAAFEADGFTHVMVVPSAFPTAAIHTMWDVAQAAVGRAVLPKEGIVEHIPENTCMKVYYSAEGFADTPTGREEFQDGLAFLGKVGVLEALKDKPEEEVTPYVACPPGELCVTLTADQVTGSGLHMMLYDTTGSDWPQAFENLPMPDWVVAAPPQMPGDCPTQMQIPLGNIMPVAASGLPQEGVQLGLVVASGDGQNVGPTDARGYSPDTIPYYSNEGLDFGGIALAVPEEDPPAEEPCQPGEICVTVTAQEVTGPDLKLMLYIATEDNWPQQFLTLPTPSWVVTQTEPVPDTWPVRIRIPLLENLYAFTDDPLEGARVGLAVVTGVASNFIVDPSDARGFSAETIVYEAGMAMDFDAVELYVPEGLCQQNPYHPYCLNGPLFWQEHMLGDQGFVPGAIYLDVHDLDGDGTADIVMVGEPHFEDENLPLTELKLGIYYMNDDLTVRETEIIDQWTETDPTFYSPWGVNVIEHGGAPMIIVGLNIPELAPLEEGNGDILSYRRVNGEWVRSVVMHNPNPTDTNYNAMIVVTNDIDNDGDEDLALSTAFGSSSVGSWMENTGDVDDPWIPHLLEPTTVYPNIRGVLAYKSADLNGDGYPEVVYNGMFDVPNTDPPQYRGEIWLAVNPGPSGWDGPWQKIVIDDDNWASADMWFHDFDGDNNPDLVANQIFDSTVSIYRHPGTNLSDPWVPEIIIDDLASPSDMWLADMDNDGQMDVVSADHTAHRGVWHKNPGPGSDQAWRPNLIFPDILLPGDFSMIDVDVDGDLDWVGTSVTLGQAFIVEQTQPDTSLVATISLPEGFEGQISSLMLVMDDQLPITGPPDVTLATIQNVDNDNDGTGDIDQVLNSSRDLVLSVEDVGVAGQYHVMAVLFMEGGGTFAPVPGVDYMAASGLLTFGDGKVEVSLDLELVPVP